MTASSLSTTTTSPPSRADWIDIARTLAMFFIMWLHVRNAPVWIHGAVNGGICLFFLLAGYFLPRAPRACALRALEQLRAWIFWMLLPSLLYILGGMDWDWQHGLGWGVGAYNAPLWFLRNLIVFQLIMALFMALRLLPRHAVLFCCILISFGYLTEWAEHTVLRFDWMMTLALGFALKPIPLAAIHAYLKRHCAILCIAALVVIAQGLLLEHVALAWDLDYDLPIAPLHALAYALLFLNLAILLSRIWPSLASRLAQVGRATMFIFVSHSLLYGGIIYAEACWLGGFRCDGPWLPVLAMLVLTPLCAFLQAKFPRAMSWIGCPAPR